MVACMSKEIVTLRTLANKLGLGKSTVQRALAGDIEVREATRERVRALAEKSGYKKNLFFAALSAHRKTSRRTTVLVAYVWGSQDPDVGREIHGRRLEMLGKLQEQGQAFGLEVIGVDLAKERRPEVLVDRLWSQGVSGLIVGLCDPVWLESLRVCRKMPVLCVQRQTGSPFHVVHTAAGERVRDAWERLQAAGYRRIGLAVMQHLSPVEEDRERLSAALGLLADVAVRNRIPPLRSHLQDVDGFREWVARHRPDAVIGFARWMWWECKYPRTGRRLPFVCLHAGVSSDTVDHICGFVEPVDELAKEAALQTSLLIRQGECGVPVRRKRVVVQPFWHEGEGIPPARRLCPVSKPRFLKAQARGMR